VVQVDLAVVKVVVAEHQVALEPEVLVFSHQNQEHLVHLDMDFQVEIVDQQG
jgi:hypothetical protein